MIALLYLVHYDTLFQSATDIIKKMRQPFSYKMQQKLITKWVRLFISKCDSFITNCDSYHRLHLFYYKIRRLLQNVSVQ